MRVRDGVRRWVALFAGLTVITAGAVGLGVFTSAPAQAANVYTVFTGYADCRPSTSPTTCSTDPVPTSQFPNPWPAETTGALPAGVVFFGDGSNMGNETDPDMSAVRIDNNSSSPIVVNDVSVNCTGSATDFGGPGAGSPLAAGNTLIVVGATPLDGSEECDTSTAVSVTVTVNGAAATYPDNQLDSTLYPQGSAIQGCLWETVSACNGTEDAPWTQIGALAETTTTTTTAPPTTTVAPAVAPAAVTVSPSFTG
jgi:hypothetical protein